MANQPRRELSGCCWSQLSQSLTLYYCTSTGSVPSDKKMCKRTNDCWGCRLSTSEDYKHICQKSSHVIRSTRLTEHQVTTYYLLVYLQATRQQGNKQQATGEPDDDYNSAVILRRRSHQIFTFRFALLGTSTPTGSASRCHDGNKLLTTSRSKAERDDEFFSQQRAG
jgi:hypothetical protein